MKSCADAFSFYHPFTCLCFFIGALVCGMCLTDPWYLALSVVLSFAYYFTLRKGRGFRMLLTMAVLFLLVSCINPLFSTYGDTVLFTWLAGRPYTLEALRYGMGTAAICVTVVVWFACYSAVMTSDKFLTLFSPLLPAISLILTMILRLVAFFMRKARQIASVRSCIGKGGGAGSEKLSAGISVLSALTSWALEGSIITADSMRSRGFGVARRTSFSIYRFTLRDGVMLSVMAAALLMLIVCTPGHLPAVCAYGVFLAIPTLIDLKENLTWHILRSRI